MKCFTEPRSSGLAKELRCANGNIYGQGWTKCKDNDSVRIQCPKNHSPCNGLTGSAEYPEFKCSTACDNSDRAQQCQGRSTTPKEHFIRRRTLTYVSAELRCIGEPRTDDTLLCADQETVSSIGWDEVGWRGCAARGSVRIQCPQGHYPCNYLLESTGFTEFHCGLTCDEHGGKRDCFVDENGDD